MFFLFLAPEYLTSSDFCSEKGIVGYPQMNLYRDGERQDTFSGNRDFDLLVDYLVKHAERSPIATSVPVLELEKSLPEPTSELGPTLTAAPVHHVEPPPIDPNSSGSVVSLGVETFDGFIKQGPAFVKFFAPWYLVDC